MNYVYLSLFLLYIILLLYFSAKTGKFLKSIILVGIVGISSLVILHLVSPYLKLTIPLNIYSLSFSALTGVPGVIFILISHMIFI